MKEALEILDQIEEQVNTCCAITMYPEDVVELIDKLKVILEGYDNKNKSNKWRISIFSI